MGFGEAFINVQLLYQSIFDMPCYYDIQKEMLIPNPKLKKRWKMPIWQAIKIGAAIGMIFFCYRFTTIFLKYKNTNAINPEEVSIYFIGILMILQASVTMYTMDVDPEEVCRINSQIFKLGGIKYKGWPSSARIPTLMELVGYGMAIVFCNFTFISAFYPLLRSYDPINIELDGILPEVPRRLLAAVLYGTLVFFGANVCAVYLLMVLTFVHVFELATLANYKLSLGVSYQNTVHPLDRIIHDILKVLFLLLEKVLRRRKLAVVPDSLVPKPQILQEIIIVKHTSDVDTSEIVSNSRSSIIEMFKVRRKRHILLSLLIERSKRTVEIFVPTMAIVGMLFCIIFNYTLVKMYDREEFRLFIALGVGLLICINMLILFICDHASLPLIYSSETIMFWKGRLTGQVERRQVRCMRPLGFTLGRFFYAKRITGLEMNDIISNATITLLLC
ncbi:unnamed protein product [Orchesella dallaii]|uniref:Odorant receptor n=1 Tax=Orchesella dallaii TaxID=48710 RepID=A0ABP1QUT3_9HEXA